MAKPKTTVTVEKTEKGKGKPTLSFDDYIKRNFGENVIIAAQAMVDRPRAIIPTTLSLDIALSGGIPEGKVVLITGKPKAGKTTLCLLLLRNAIRLGRPAFYVDIERRCDAALLKTVPDLDLSRLRVIQSTSGKVLSAQDWFDILERTIKDHPNAVIIVDSLAMLSTLIEQSSEFGENADMAGVPKLSAKFFRRMKDVIDTNNVVLAFISQLQTNRDPASKKKFDEKGGMGVQYQCSVWLSADWFQLWDRDSATNRPFGQNVMFNIKSSALGAPYIPCAVPLRYGEGIDIVRDVCTHAENVGIIEKAGAWYSIPPLVEGDPALKFQGLEALRLHMKTNPLHLAALDHQVREIVIPISVPYADKVAQWTPDES